MQFDFGADAENLISQGTASATNKSNITIVPDTIYYWQIINYRIYILKIKLIIINPILLMISNINKVFNGNKKGQIKKI
ncbi:hypothetical protein GCM10022396_09300 [Flavivirga amylovorans]